MTNAKDLLSGWIELSGFPKFTTSLLPFLLGSVVAWFEDPASFNAPVLAFSLVAVFLISEFCFVLNASSVYADVKRKGRDPANVKDASALHNTATSGRFNALAKGLITPEQADFGAVLCVIAAIPIGVLLQFYYQAGALTLPLGLIGIFIAYAYSRGPRFSYHGLGELAITIGVGWMTVFSGYYLQAARISMLPTIVALPWLIEVFKLKLTREIPDYECDRLINRRNLVVRMGKRATANLYLPLTLCSWLAFVPILSLDTSIPKLLFLLLALPLFFTAKSLIALRSFKQRLAETRSRAELKQDVRALTRNAFTGMILIPVALMLILGLGKLV
ncbi:MAG: prenyltransferase [Candidatus Methanospirareceae archaeon]